MVAGGQDSPITDPTDITSVSRLGGLNVLGGLKRMGQKKSAAALVVYLISIYIILYNYI